MLDVADVADAAAAMAEADSRSAPPGWLRGCVSTWVPSGKDKRLAGPEAVMLEMRRQLVEPDREERRREQSLERFLGALTAEIAAIGADDAVGAERTAGLKKGRPLM